MQGLDDKIALTFSRAITRRRFLKKSMQAGLATGGALSTSMFFARAARADHSQCYYQTNAYGCYCNSATPTCSQYQTGWCLNYDSCPSAPAWRCNGWGSYPYCWCSTNCNISGHNGYYHCCDCWYYGMGSTCDTGSGACICGKRYLTS